MSFANFAGLPACKPVKQLVDVVLLTAVRCRRCQFQLWTKVLRSKLDHDSSKRSERHDVSKRDVVTESGEEMQSTPSTSSHKHDYMPPWFNRYVEYKFNLLDRTGLSIGR